MWILTECNWFALLTGIQESRSSDLPLKAKSHVFPVRLPLCSKKLSALSLEKYGTSTQVELVAKWTYLLYLKVYSHFYMEIILVWARLLYTESHLWLRRLGSYVGFLPWLLFYFLLVVKTIGCQPWWLSKMLRSCLTKMALRSSPIRWKRTTSSIKLTI